jgi:hypothetical protein
MIFKPSFSVQLMKYLNPRTEDEQLHFSSSLIFVKLFKENNLMPFLPISPLKSNRKGKEQRTLMLWKQKNIYFQYVSVESIEMEYNYEKKQIIFSI